MPTKIPNPETLTKKRKLAALLIARAGSFTLSASSKRSYAALAVNAVGWLCDYENGKENEATYYNMLVKLIDALKQIKEVQP